ncbi:homeobox protein Hox-A3 isoform X2 [Pithys albifrons albifrons]|uniref:homeobox protein Hox-A3 isoform X2 n=1 Tax=Pithys albifrons albifrons TaxID=3385563 RepID=UPI003A5CDF01
MVMCKDTASWLSAKKMYTLLLDIELLTAKYRMADYHRLRRARPKTLEVEVCQYFKERPNHLGVNWLAAGNITPLTLAPIFPPPTKKNGPLPRSLSSFFLQAFAIPGVSLHDELSCDKHLVGAPKRSRSAGVVEEVVEERLSPTLCSWRRSARRGHWRKSTT